MLDLLKTYKKARLAERKKSKAIPHRSKLKENLARPRGFEPPAYRSVVCSNTESQGTAGKRRLIFLALGCLSSLPYPTVLAQSGHNLVTNNVAVGCIAYRFIVLRSPKTNTDPTTYQGLRPACDHSIKGLYGSLSNTSTVWLRS